MTRRPHDNEIAFPLSELERFRVGEVYAEALVLVFAKRGRRCAGIAVDHSR